MSSRYGRDALSNAGEYPAWNAQYLDFLPLMTLQSRLNPNLEISRLRAQLTIKLSAGKGDLITTPLGGRIMIGGTDTVQKTPIDYDLGRDTAPQKEIWREIVDSLGIEKPEATIQENTFKVPIKGDLLKNEHARKVLDGMSDLYVGLVTRASAAPSTARKLGYDFARPYVIAKTGLAEHDEPTANLWRHLRGVQIGTRYLATDGTHARGINELFQPDVTKSGTRSPAAIHINEALAGPNYWQDVGIPQPLSGQVNGFSLQTRVMLLWKNHVVVCLG